MDKILITGFENFGDYKENITHSLSQEISTLSGYSLEYMIFPVRIFSNGAENYGKQVVERAQKINAKAIISLGMASDVRGVRIESRALNWVENKKYCEDSEQERLIDNNLPPKYCLQLNLTKWNINKIFACFKETGIIYESRISTDANFFCCNALMFRILQSLRKTKCSIPYIFLHIPCSYKAVENLPYFDKNKHLISMTDLAELLSIFISNINLVLPTTKRVI